MDEYKNQTSTHIISTYYIMYGKLRCRMKHSLKKEAKMISGCKAKLANRDTELGANNDGKNTKPNTNKLENKPI